jgi:predicted nucleic acid-binding protein
MWAIPHVEVDRILGEALAGKADLLVTGDRDLLELKKLRSASWPPRGFLSRRAGGGR